MIHHSNTARPEHYRGRHRRRPSDRPTFALLGSIVIVGAATGALMVGR